jgi:hypothetical protein
MLLASLDRHAAGTHELHPGLLPQIPPWIDDDRTLGKLELQELRMVRPNEKDAVPRHVPIVHLNIVSALPQQVLSSTAGLPAVMLVSLLNDLPRMTLTMRSSSGGSEL